MDFAGALSSLTTAIAVLKDMNDVENQLAGAELKLKIVELTNSLFTAQTTLLDAQKEIQGLRDDVENLEKAYKRKSDLMDVNGFCYDATEDGKPRKYPYCGKCIEVEMKFIRLVQKDVVPFQAFCPNCSNTYTNDMFSQFCTFGDRS